MDLDEHCVICSKSLREGATVTVTRGIPTLIAASVRRCDNLFPSGNTIGSVTVHEDCRKQYTRENSIRAAEKSNVTGLSTVSPVKSRLRLHTATFNFKECCIFCAEKCEEGIEKRKPLWRRRSIQTVSTLSLQGNILQKCNERNEDTLSKEVKYRLDGIFDLVAEEARYHADCMSNFFGKATTQSKRGRPDDSRLNLEFEQVCSFLENSDECQFSIEELLDMMTEYRPSEKWLKEMLKSKYGDSIIITSVHKKAPIICFLGTGHKILSQAWYNEKKANEDEERLRIVRTASAIIREDIRRKLYETETYICGTVFFDNVENDIPTSLKVFIDSVIVKKSKVHAETVRRKSTAICHSIISAVRPRSFISSVQLGLSVYLHRKYGSKLLIDITSHLGYCSSYHDAILYEASVALQSEEQRSANEETFTQYVFDNSDFDVHTIDGRNTFHCMGGIECSTPTNALSQSKFVAKLSSVPIASILAASCEIPTVTFSRSGISGLKSIKIQDITLFQPVGQMKNANMGIASDLLWMIGKWLDAPLLPGWHGFMENITRDMSYETTKIHFLPFVNLKANSDDAVNTVLHLASSRCQSIGQRTCFVTFDQPLYARARDIISYQSTTQLSHVIIRLGGFHMLMSFLGAIGYIMDGSGLKELWSTVYAEKSIDKMMTGHSFARSLRAHLLTQLALAKIVLNGCDICETDMDSFSSMFVKLQTEPASLLDADNTNEVTAITDKFSKQQKQLANKGNTAKLWIQYFDLVRIVREFIKAERMGDWQLHLNCVRQMIPFFHASGHLSYAKSSHLYLQDMQALPETMSKEELHQFTNKYFTIRRTNKFWAGIWSDLTIEQTLMRSMKTSGGLTHGRGISPSVLARWILGMPASIDTCNAVEKFAGVESLTSEQHVDIRISKITRDDRDAKIFTEWFQCHYPFPEHKSVMSIATGVIGNDSINCHNSYDIGTGAMQAMVGNNFNDVKLKRNDRVRPLSVMTLGMKLHDAVVPINPTLLFQRIVHTVKKREDLQVCFEYELSPSPQAIFDENGMMRKNKKSVLYTIFKPTVQCPLVNVIFVVDGGFLLHRVVWPAQSKYCNIFQCYVNFVRSHYGLKSIVVFDGYCTTETNTKNAERQRRSGKAKCADINFSEDMTVNCTQEAFLSNDNNKSRFIQHLSLALTDSGVTVKQAPDDADTLIVNTAINVSNSTSSTAVVVGEDIDLLILIMALCPQEKDILLLKPGRGHDEDSIYSSAALQSVHSDITRHILFLHACSGCDTTSAFYRLGKTKFVKIYQNKKYLHDFVQIFYDENSDPEQIAKSGERFLLSVYGAPEEEDSLNKHRFLSFIKAVARSSCGVNLASLPPTSSASRQHFLRVYHQVQLWLGRSLQPEVWGWISNEYGLVPIKTDKDPAPKMLLNLVFCNCSKGCNAACSCKKAGLKCSDSCGYCHGIACSNAAPCDLLCDDENDDENNDLTNIDNNDEAQTDSYSMFPVYIDSDNYYDFSYSCIEEVVTEDEVSDKNY